MGTLLILYCVGLVPISISIIFIQTPFESPVPQTLRMGAYQYPQWFYAAPGSDFNTGLSSPR